MKICGKKLLALPTSSQVPFELLFLIDFYQALDSIVVVSVLYYHLNTNDVFTIFLFRHINKKFRRDNIW